MRLEMAVRSLVAGVAAVFACHAAAVAPADRQARVDAQGVMRWTDDGSEVAVFGVNYYAPFALDYRVLRERGCDVKETIRRDVAQFRRLGLNAIRLHCFDREFSTREGAFVDNDHVDALDYLVSECASNGIYTVLTPIAAWGGGKWTSCTNGFAYPVGIKTLTSDRDLWKAEARFEREFAEHVNRYTGRRYADDPCVLCFELINEPGYPDGTTSEQVAEYANALLDGIRRSGTKKPVFYSATWNGRNDCVPMLKTDGVSGVYYATGLEAGHALPGPQLGFVKGSSLKADSRLDGKAKIVYEFDAADTPGAYMYPAMARLFRSEGAQSATQFQYDPTPLAADNVSYRTHYLNLVYTPEKAMSLAIASEVFRRLPRGTSFAAEKNEMVFPPFRVNAESNLSEMVTETALLYTATPLTPVPALEKLRRVWGCGSSPVVASSGNGCYFLDKVADGQWRLQLYPSVMPCADPYTGDGGKKTVVLADCPELTVRLPDLGADFTAWRVSDGSRAASARGGRVVLAPGDYVLSRGAPVSPAQLAAADVPEWWAPQPDLPDPNRKRWPPTLAELVAEGRAKFPTPRDWNFFDAALAVRCSGNGGWTEAAKDDRGRPACRYRATNFVEREAMSAYVPSDGKVYAAAFPEAGEGRTLVVTGHAVGSVAEQVEVALRLDDGQVWGTNVTLPRHWSEVRVPFSDFRYFSHWNVPERQDGFRLDIRRLDTVCLCFGKWLDPSAAGRAHAFEISSIRVEQ
ncbi:MAG: cellulase family glycosylhydrolase [Kiritimatiellae bacterium]|nr:cellulase family glycosylhydrolase [Kiritimatiellia bacterium]